MRTRNVIVEGDSSLVISTAKRIQAGSNVSKVIKQWRLSKVTENIAELLNGMRGIVFQLVRRKANSLADHLANWGVDNPNFVWDRCWQEVDCPMLKASCTQLAAKDLEEAGRA